MNAFCLFFPFIISPLQGQYVTNTIVEFSISVIFTFSLVLFKIWPVAFYSLLIVEVYVDLFSAILLVLVS